MERIEYIKRSIDFSTLYDIPPHFIHQGLSNDLDLPSLENSTYIRCYCEENVWKLCEQVRNHNPEKMGLCFAVFISNTSESVALWSQKCGEPPHGLTVWDYHVIFVYNAGSTKGSLIYDLDSSLPFYPVHIDIYAPYTFRMDKMLNSQFHRLFRVVPCETYLKHFASDRSRMKRADGSWQAPPPDYPCICTSESSNNLSDFVSMDSEIGVGEVMNLNQFVDRFSSKL